MVSPFACADKCVLNGLQAQANEKARHKCGGLFVGS